MPPAPVDKVNRFRALHRKGAPFLIPNLWDAGSAKILAGLGFEALATTSSGFANSKARTDYRMTRDEVIAHCREASGVVDIPVSADLENGFGPEPRDCAETITSAADTGLCGGSIEDTTGAAQRPIHDIEKAVDRVRAAVAAAHAAPSGFVLTARADAFLYGQGDLNEVIKRLQAYDDAGADVLFAPGLPSLTAVSAVCSSVSKPVNVLIYGALAQHSMDEFAQAGVARVSVGGALANLAYGALVEAATSIAETRSFTALGQRPEAVKRFKAILSR